MNIDLFRDPLTQAGGTDLYRAIEDFTRVSEPPPDRTPEGYLVDFKEKWSDSALKTTAAFANTFGGLLIIGVSEAAGRADQLVGVSLPPGRELKTSIAGAIAANISPTPSYDLAECTSPTDATKHLCVVRVREGDVLHLISKKGEQPVYVRNEDQSIPADASRLQALLARTARPRVAAVNNQTLLTFDSNAFFVSKAHGPGTTAQRLQNRDRSQTFLRVVLVPAEALALRLDLLTEQKFDETVARTYPNLAERKQDQSAIVEEARGRDFYQLSYLEDGRDYHMLWLLRDHGEIHLAAQVAMSVPPIENTWSLADVITHIDSTIATAHEIWDSVGYFGEGRILVHLAVEGLSLLTTGVGYSSAFYSTGKILPNGVLSRPLTRQNLARTQATAEAKVTYYTRTVDRTETLALLINQLIRDLGYAVNFRDLMTILN